MAALTTTRAGDYANVTAGVTPWTALTGSGPGGIPGIGDTFTANHALTISTAETVGTSPATTSAIVSVNNNGTTNLGSITIQDGGSLTVRGGITLAGSAGASAYLKVEAGGTLTIDSSNATATVRYDLRMNGTTDYFEFAGVDGNRAVATNSNAAMALVGGTPAALGARFRGVGTATRLKGRFADFTRFGGTTTWYATYFSVFPDFEDCTFDACGSFQCSGAWTSASVFKFVRCKFTNSVADCIIANSANVLNSTGTRAITDCVFDRGFGICMSDCTVNTNIISGYQSNAGTVQTTGLGLYEDCLFILPQANSGRETNARYVNCYILGYNQATNARFSATSNTYGDPDADTPVFDRLIFDYPNTSSVVHSGLSWSGSAFGDTGDLIQTQSTNPASSITTTLRNSIALPISTGHTSDGFASRGIYPGTMFTGRNQPNCHLKAIGNTWLCYDGLPTTSHGAIGVAEGVAAIAGIVTAFYDNVLWSYVDSHSPALLSELTSANNSYTTSGVYNNASFNILTINQPSSSSDDTIYYGPSTGTVGANDLVDVDPQFVDSTRCFVKWVRTLRGDLGSGASNGAGSYTGATYDDEATITFGLTEIKKKLDAGFDPRYTVAALQAYVREGFAPTNPVYRFASSTYATPGAVAGSYPHMLSLMGCGS